MATIKFKGDSPYTLTPIVPQEDFIYDAFIRDFEMKEKEMQKVFGFALFGAGKAGTIHLSSIVRNPKINLLYIIEEDKNKWDSVILHWNLTHVKFLTTSEVDEVFHDERVRAVVVASPTQTHEPIVLKALANNKAVFCEKPIAETIEKARRCYEKATETKQPLLTAFNRRLDPAYKSIKERVQKGEIGHASLIKICSRDSPLPNVNYLKISGGIFHDTAVHDIDMMIWILGEYPIRVSVAATANIPEIREIGDYDTVAIIFTFPSGTVGMIDLSRFSNYGYDQRLEVFGFKGMLKAENQKPIQGIECYGTKNGSCPIYHSFPSRYKSAYAAELQHFLNVLEGKENVLVDSRDVLAGSKIASACAEAAKTRKVVNIHWNEEEISSNSNLLLYNNCNSF